MHHSHQRKDSDNSLFVAVIMFQMQAILRQLTLQRRIFEWQSKETRTTTYQTVNTDKWVWSRDIKGTGPWCKWTIGLSKDRKRGNTTMAQIQRKRLSEVEAQARVRMWSEDHCFLKWCTDWVNGLDFYFWPMDEPGFPGSSIGLCLFQTILLQTTEVVTVLWHPGGLVQFQKCSGYWTKPPLRSWCKRTLRPL